MIGGKSLSKYELRVKNKLPSYFHLWQVGTPVTLADRIALNSIIFSNFRVQCNRGRKAIKELSYLSGKFSLITEWNYWNTLQVFNPADDNSYKGKKWKRHFAKPKRHSSIEYWCLKRSEMFIGKDEVLSSLLRSTAGSSSSVMERAVWRHFKKAQRLTISWKSFLYH